MALSFSKKAFARKKAREKRESMAKIRQDVLSKRTPEQLQKASSAVSKGLEKAPAGSEIFNIRQQQLRELQQAQGLKPMGKTGLSVSREAPTRTVTGPSGQTANIKAGIGFEKPIEELARTGGGVGSKGEFISPGQRDMTVREQTTGSQTTNDLMNRLQQAQREAAIAGFEAERKRVSPEFAEARREAITEAQRGARSFGEYLASRGLGGAPGGAGPVASGAEAQATIAQNVAQQQALGGLRQAEAQTFADIERRRQQALAGIEATGAERALDERRFQEQLALQRAGLTGVLGGEQTLAGRAAEQSAQMFDIQRQQIEQALEAGQISNEQARYALDQARDPNSIQNQAANIELQLAQANLAFLPQQQQLQLEQLRRSIAQIGRQPVLSEVQKRQQELQLLQLNNEIARLTGGDTGVPLATVEEISAGIESQLGRVTPTGENKLTGEKFVTGEQQKSVISQNIALAIIQGVVDSQTVESLKRIYAITDDDLIRAEQSLARTQGQVTSVFSQ